MEWKSLLLHMAILDFYPTIFFLVLKIRQVLTLAILWCVGLFALLVFGILSYNTNSMSKIERIIVPRGNTGFAEREARRNDLARACTVVQKFLRKYDRAIRPMGMDQQAVRIKPWHKKMLGCYFL